MTIVRPSNTSGTALLLATLLSVTGTAWASGGSTPVTAAEQNRVIGQSSYRCKGGIRVQVTQMPSTARVDFAGRSQVLNLMPEGSAIAYRNGTFGWSSQGKASSLKNLRSGALILTDCVAVGE
ncbi:MliC family protein [Deinococcus sp.]|uniref:MliC family protein n=1 Tax=Deinococcus sp. TaxID=47478 RepID=UPI00286E63DF|nr:MliC family protein [Deinococcus sp.]